MNAISIVSSGLSAAVRLARGRADGIVLVNSDRATVVNSFWAVPFCLPSVICRLIMSWVSSGVPANAGYLIARELILFVLGWVVFVEATHYLAGFLGRTHRWGRFIAVWNWCNVIEGVLIVVGCIPGLLGVPAVIDETCQLVMIGWALWLEWYATRLALGVTGGVAASFVIFDQALGIFLASIAVTLHP